MAKNKRPFSSLLEDPTAKKAVAEALHAPSQLPTPEPTPEPITAVVQSAPDVSPTEAPVKLKPGPKPKPADEKEEYVNITIRKSIHKYLKMAAVQNNLEIREVASDAIEAHPLVVEMVKRFG